MREACIKSVRLLTGLLLVPLHSALADTRGVGFGRLPV